MSNLGMIMFKSLCNENDKALMKTLSDWILQEVRALDYPQLTAYCRKRTKVLLRFLSGAVY